MTIQLGLAIALALFAGLISWIGGRTMLRHTGDPMFADRLFAHRVAMIRVYFVLLAITAMLAPKQMLWLTALTLLSISIGGFPARRTLYDETWSFPEYLGTRLRLIAFAGGPWLALLFAPAIIQQVGLRWSWLVLLGVFALYVFQQELLLVGLATKPITDQELLSRFESISAKAKAHRPKIYQGGWDQGRFVNAFALPAGRWSSIVFTRRLLAALDPDEVAAIFGHETAHLEQYAQRQFRIRVWLGRFLIPMFAVLPQILLLMNSPREAIVISLAWPVVLLLALLGVLASRQKNETLADLRALELGVDPHVLISALEKIHRLNGMPRRLDANRERRMSHPTLSRRVQAIRRKAGIELPPAIDLPRVVAGRVAGTFIRFTPESIEVFDRKPDEGVAPARSYRYDSLTSLLLRRTRSGWELMGQHGKKKIHLPVAEESTADVHLILDSVDQHLAEVAVQPRGRRDARIAALLIFLLSLTPGVSFVPLVVSILAIISGSAASLAALGTTTVIAGALAFAKRPEFFPSALVMIFATAGILIGVLSLILVRRIPKEERGRHVRFVVVSLSIIAFIAFLPTLVLLTFGSPLLQLLIAARTSPAVAILLFGIAAALYAASKRRAATIPAAAALLYALIGTHMFASMTSSDPLFSNHQATWIAPPRPIVSREVGSMAGVLRLSPDARSFAVGSIGDDEEESLPEKFTVGRIDGPLTEIDASDVAFLHSEAILRLKATDESARVDTVTTTGVSGAWHVETLPVWSPHLEAKANGEWILSGTSIAQARELVVRGRIGSPAFAQLPRPIGTVYATVTGSERMPEWMYVISQMRGGTEFRRTATPLDQTVGSTILGFGQTFEMPDTHQWVVVAHDKTSTYAGILDEHENHVRPAGVVNERSHHVAAGRGSRLALNSASAAVVWNLRTNKAMRLSCPTCVVLDVALADRVAGVLWMRGGAVSVALFPTDVLE